jgi:hypothetical protein
MSQSFDFLAFWAVFVFSDRYLRARDPGAA